jgi:LysR family cys regulon transcriptional activator
MCCKSIDLIMREVGNLKRIGEQFSAQDSGTLSIATTHTQARYVLPVPVAKLREAYPKVNVSLHQGAPDQVARMVLDEVAEIGIATESLSGLPRPRHPALLRMAARAGAAAAHPLAKKERFSLEDLAAEPIITYHPSFTGRTRIDTAFASRKLTPRIALEAIDSDVIKTYVRLGLGIGIVAEMAVRDDGSNSDLVVRPLGQLFGQNVARVAFKRSAYLRNFVYKFAELLSDRLDRNLIAKAMTGHVNDYELYFRPI